MAQLQRVEQLQLLDRGICNRGINRVHSCGNGTVLYFEHQSNLSCKRFVWLLACVQESSDCNSAELHCGECCIVV
jgi:hypothetical protein